MINRNRTRHGFLQSFNDFKVKILNCLEKIVWKVIKQISPPLFTLFSVFLQYCHFFSQFNSLTYKKTPILLFLTLFKNALSSWSQFFHEGHVSFFLFLKKNNQPSANAITSILKYCVPSHLPALFFILSVNAKRAKRWQNTMSKYYNTRADQSPTERERERGL